MKHIVLERARTAEHWRTMRWDSLVANGPAWHDRFPNMEFKDRHQDAFVPKEEVADYLVDYAKMFNAPIREGIDVRAVTRMASSSGFLVNTSEGVIETSYVISATGAFQSPMVPPIVPDIAGIKQIHSTDYRNSSELPNGNVLIVGAGSSGAQISMDLMKTSRKIFLSVGSHDRPPRRYRNRDFCWWLGVLNLWDAEANPSSTHTTIAVSGADGGSTVDFRKLANQGLTLLGLTEGFQDGVLTFANNLSETIREGDKNYLSILDLADAYAERNGLDLPLDLEARKIGPDPQCISSPIRSVDLRAENINTIIWATGFSNDYSWLQVDAFEATNAPSHKRGISSEPGVYFLGLPWQSRRGSSFIWGVWHDAKFIVDHIQKQQGYLAYKGSAERLPVEWSKK